jgi:hypothetical protein
MRCQVSSFLKMERYNEIRPGFVPGCGSAEAYPKKTAGAVAPAIALPAEPAGSADAGVVADLRPGPGDLRRPFESAARPATYVGHGTVLPPFRFTILLPAAM